MDWRKSMSPSPSVTLETISESCNLFFFSDLDRIYLAEAITFDRDGSSPSGNSARGEKYTAFAGVGEAMLEKRERGE